MNREQIMKSINANLQSLFKVLNISLEGHIGEKLLWTINDSLSEPYKDINGNQESWRSDWKCISPLPCQKEFECKGSKRTFESIIKKLINFVLNRINNS